MNLKFLKNKRFLVFLFERSVCSVCSIDILEVVVCLIRQLSR